VRPKYVAFLTLVSI